MSYTDIFTDGFCVRFVYDDADEDAPIGIIASDDHPDNPDHWLSRDEAVEGAKAILSALSEDVPAIRTETTGDSLNEDLILVAVAHDRPIRFRYAKGSGATIEVRTLKPEKVTEAGADKHAVVQGYDPDRDDFRMYRLDRIKGKVAIG